jgi:tetratricopeptide (TPR) repeat protein
MSSLDGNTMMINDAQREQLQRSILAPREDSFEIYVQAADAAMQVFAYDEARQHYAAAFHCATRIAGSDQQYLRLFDALINFVAAGSTTHAPMQNLQRLEESAQLLDLVATAQRERRIILDYWRGRTFYYGGSTSMAERYLQRAMAHPHDAQLHTSGAIQGLFGQVLFVQGRFRAALPIFAEALPLIEQSSNSNEYRGASGYYAVCLVATGKIHAGLQIVNENIAAAEHEGDLKSMASNYGYRAHCFLHAGDYRAMYAAGQRFTELGEQANERFYCYLGYLCCGWAETRLGMPQAARSMEKAQAILATIGGRLYAADWFAAAAAEMELLLGNLDAARHQAEEAKQIAHSIDGLYGKALAERVLCLVSIVQEPTNSEAAQHHAHTAIALFEECGAVLEAARMHTEWAAYCEQHDRPDQAWIHIQIAQAIIRETDLANTAIVQNSY